MKFFLKARWWLRWTGYDRYKDMTDKRAKLDEACRGVVGDPDLTAIIDLASGVALTYCNYAVNRICLDAFDYHAFEDDKKKPLLASKMIDKISTDTAWRADSGERAQEWANKGGLAVACRMAVPHGHIAVIAPSDVMPFSSKWNKRVPFCANVGRHNGLMGANYAFDGEPDYYRYLKSGADGE